MKRTFSSVEESDNEFHMEFNEKLKILNVQDILLNENETIGSDRELTSNEVEERKSKLKISEIPKPVTVADSLRSKFEIELAKCKHLDWTACCQAVMMGSLTTLQWLRSLCPPAPWNARVMSAAASQGRLDIIKWARAQSPPCPWDRRVCGYASAGGHSSLLRWAIDNGCTYCEKECDIAAKTVLIGYTCAKSLNESFKKRTLHSYNTHSTSVKSSAPASLTSAECTIHTNVVKSVNTLKRAFMSDPVFNYLVPEMGDREIFIHNFFTLLVSLLPGRVYQYMDFGGVMLWARGTVENVDTMAFITNGGLLNLSLENKRNYHLKGATDYYFLMDIGVDPENRGQGYGSTMLDYFVKNHADKEGVPCYLEATTDSSRRLYERHKFVVVETVQVPPNGPKMYLMLRQPVAN